MDPEWECTADAWTMSTCPKEQPERKAGRMLGLAGDRRCRTCRFADLWTISLRKEAGWRVNQGVTMKKTERA